MLFGLGKRLKKPTTVAEKLTKEDTKPLKEVEPTKPKTFEEYYHNLSPEEKAKVDKRIERLAYRYRGELIKCVFCNKPGGTLRKSNDGRYYHEACRQREISSYIKL